MATTKHHYSQKPETLYAAISDPEHLKARAEAAGHRNVTVKVDEKSDGCTIHMERDIEAEIPSFAKKVVSPVNHVVTRFDWKKEADGWSGTYTADVNPRIRITSKVEIRPVGDGCEYVDTYTAHVDVPLIGKKIAALVEKETGEAVVKDLDWTARHLD